MPPNLITKLLNLFNTLTSSVSKAGPILVTKAVAKARLSICEQCDKQNNGTCIECGCVLKFKTSLHASTCPLKRW